MIPDYFKSTRFKLKVANLIYRILKFLGINEIQMVKRNGIYFELDLKEGIDLSIFLFGSFQKHVWKSIKVPKEKESIFIDIGANIGAITLNLAKEWTNAYVLAIEPTDYAFEKLSKNINLNPILKNKIGLVQAFIKSNQNETQIDAVYSSWRIDGSIGDHPIHGGNLQKVTDKSISLDKLTKEKSFKRVDFIKIDVDGFEFDVLLSGKNTLASFRPIVMFEFMGHSGRGTEAEFPKYEAFFHELGYTLHDSSTNLRLNSSNIIKAVPKHGGIDILALPN